MIIKRRPLLQAALLGLLPAAQAQPRGALPLVFPRDFGSHPQARIEWWYLTGVLAEAAEAPPQFGFQLTFFRVRGPAAADHPSAFAARQVLLGHAAVSDLAGGRLHHEQLSARAGFGLAEASETNCDLRLHDWFLRRGAEGYAGAARGGAFALQLQLRSTQAVLLQGEQGFSRKGPDPEQFSHYYSEVQLRTEARLTLNGREHRLLGRAWFDHEWSDSLLGRAADVGGGQQAIGWDWLGINLDDGAALTLFQLRRADGSTLWAGGSWRTAAGGTTAFTPEQVGMQALRRWRSPGSGAEYPVEWALRTPAGDFRLKALLDSQEIDARQSAGMRYWEGAALLSDAQGRRLGAGYLELTGYAGTMRGV